MAARTAQQPPDLTGLVAAIGVAAGVAAAVFGYGGAPLVLAGLVTAGFMARPPAFTGKKDRAGQPTPAHPGESKQMRVFRIWKDLRWRLFTPNLDWLPGKDPLATWFAGLLAGVAVAGLPVSALPDLGWAPALNGLLAAIVVWQVSATLRRFAADYDPSPGLRLSALRRLPQMGKLWLALVAGAVVAVVAGATFAGAFIPETVRGAYGANSRFVSAWALGLIAGGAVLGAQWRKLSLSTWRELVTTREQWEPRWATIGLKDDNPWLVEHTTYGPVTVDTFDAPASTGAAYFCTPATTGKVTVALGANQRVWIISSPNEDGQGQPVPGSAHPTRFRVVHLPADQMPDLTDHTLDPEMVKVLLEGAMGAACDIGGVSRYLLMSADLVTQHAPESSEQAPAVVGGGDEPVDVEDLDELEEDTQVESSPWAVWATTWVNPDGLDGSYLRTRVRGPLSGALNLPVLVDHRFGGGQGLVLIGPASHPEVVFDPGTGLTTAKAVDIEREDVWRSHWESVLKQGVNAPRPELSLYAEAKLPGRRYAGTTVYYLPFVTLKGEPPEMYFGLESKLAAALNAAPFVATTGFPGANATARPGDRHSQALCVIWSDGPVPDGPQSLAPTPRGQRSDVAKWVLAGRFNAAFKAARLAQPEVAAVRCLTSERSAGHIWRVDVRLYGGVTLSDVRGAAARIRGALGCSWLRVADAEDGCIIFAGERPEKVTLARPDADRNLLIALDWEQAWLDSKVSGVGGLLPKLTNAAPLPKNPKVEAIDFDLPAGLSMEDIKAAVPKLKTATSNTFIEVRPGDSASSVRLLVCEVNPLPDMVEFDFDYIDSSNDIPFASSVEGEPVSYDYMVDPHLLIVGGSGSGKSATLQGLLYGVLAFDCDVYIADPTKGGADFRFALPWVKSFTADVFETSAMMDAIYAEVLRRKNLNSEHGVGSYTELPEDVRPRHAIVVLDEFTSLMIADQLPPKPEPEDEAGQQEYEYALALKSAKQNIGSKAGRIAREARSAGVTLLLATQRLTAKTLDGIPGASDLRTNMARMILGKATFGEMQSALKEPTAAPALGDVVPRGRGLLEVSGDRIRMIQCWYIGDIQRTLAAKLAERREPLREDEKVDLAPFMAKTRGAGAGGDKGRAAAAQAEPEVVDIGEVEIEWDMSAFEVPAEGDDDDSDQAQVESSSEPEFFPGESPASEPVFFAEPTAPAPELPDVFATPAAGAPVAVDASSVLFLDVDNTVCPVAGSGWADAVQVDSPHGHVWVSPSMMARLGAAGAQVVWATDWHDDAAPVLDPLLGRVSAGALGRASGEEYGWWKIDAIVAWLDEHPQVRTVVFADDRLDRADELDVEYRETLADVLEHRGVRHLLLVPSGPDLTEQDVEQIEAMFGRVPAREPVAPVAVAEPEPAAKPQRPARAERAKRDLPPREQWVRPGSAKPKEYIEEF